MKDVPKDRYSKAARRGNPDKPLPGPDKTGPGFTGIPTVPAITAYVKANYADIFMDNGPSSPFRWMYPVIYTKHARHTLNMAAYAHDAGYWMLRLEGSPFASVSRKNWDMMYRNYIRSEGHRWIAGRQYRALRAFGGKAWKKNGRWMAELGYVNTHIWAMIKRNATAGVQNDGH